MYFSQDNVKPASNANKKTKKLLVKLPYFKTSKANKVDILSEEEVNMDLGDDDADNEEHSLKIDETFTEEPEQPPEVPALPVKSGNKRKLAQTLNKLSQRAKMSKTSKTDEPNPLLELSRAAGFVEDD